MVSAVVVLATLAAYWGVLSIPFAGYDDEIYVTENTHVQAGLSRESVAWRSRPLEASNWHPLTWLSHMLDVQLFGMDAGRHHLTSLFVSYDERGPAPASTSPDDGGLWRSALVAGFSPSDRCTWNR